MKLGTKITLGVIGFVLCFFFIGPSLFCLSAWWLDFLMAWLLRK